MAVGCGSAPGRNTCWRRQRVGKMLETVASLLQLPCTLPKYVVPVVQHWGVHGSGSLLTRALQPFLQSHWYYKMLLHTDCLTAIAWSMYTLAAMTKIRRKRLTVAMMQLPTQPRLHHRRKITKRFLFTSFAWKHGTPNSEFQSQPRSATTS